MRKKNEVTHCDPFDAFRRLVYSQDVKVLAVQMGMRPGTLYNKADADVESHNQPSLRDVVLLSQLTGDMRVLDALDAMFHRAAFDVTPYTLTSDAALLELVTQMGIENGHFHAELNAALIDGHFTSMELQRLRKEALEMVSALMTVVKRVEGLIDE